MNPDLPNMLETNPTPIDNTFANSPSPLLNVPEPTVSANALTTPAPSVSIPTPSQPSQPSTFVQNLEPAIQAGSQGVQNLQQQIIQAQTAEAEQRNNILNQLLSMEGLNTQDTFQNALNQSLANITGQDPNEFMQQLSDANVALATLQGKFRSGAQAISGAQGQSKVFEGVQLNELERQRAVEVGNQALLVQALQGNFDTARQIALDTANFASEDKKVELQNLLAQYDALTGIVDQQTQQLLDQEKAKIQAELADTERTQGLVDNAIVAGMATVEEMQYLTSTEVDNATKQRIAMEIINRGARSDRFAGAGGASEGDVLTTDAQAQSIISDLNVISDLLNDTQGLNKAVGKIKTSRGVTRRGAGDRFVSKLNNLLSSGVLKQISDAKAMGVTFGALSDSELTLVASAANRINNWVETDKQGRVIGYRTSEQNMKDALKEIQDTLQKKYQSTTGQQFYSNEDLLNVDGTQDAIYTIQ